MFQMTSLKIKEKCWTQNMNQEHRNIIYIHVFSFKECCINIRMMSEYEQFIGNEETKKGGEVLLINLLAIRDANDEKQKKNLLMCQVWGSNPRSQSGTRA